MKSQESGIKIGFAQILIELGNISANTLKVESEAKKHDYDLLVFPELAITGYDIKTRIRLKKLSFRKDDQNFDNLEKLCRDECKSIVFGFAEKSGERIYNSAMLIDERGKRHIYRKTHLFCNEKKIFDSGDTGFIITKVKSAKVGMMICFDWMFPESMRTLALRGADIVAHPSNLVMPYCQNAMVTRCLENRLYAVTANRIGEEGNYRFTGGSRITSIIGEVLAGGNERSESVKIVHIDYKSARDKNINRLNNLFTDRREEFYEL